MSWQTEIQLRDLNEDQALEARCRRCAYVWTLSPRTVWAKVAHHNVYLDEVAHALVCPKPGCRHKGTHLTLIRTDEANGFIGGMP